MIKRINLSKKKLILVSLGVLLFGSIFSYKLYQNHKPNLYFRAYSKLVESYERGELKLNDEGDTASTPVYCIIKPEVDEYGNLKKEIVTFRLEKFVYQSKDEYGDIVLDAKVNKKQITALNSLRGPKDEGLEMITIRENLPFRIRTVGNLFGDIKKHDYYKDVVKDKEYLLTNAEIEEVDKLFTFVLEAYLKEKILKVDEKF